MPKSNLNLPKGSCHLLALRETDMRGFPSDLAFRDSPLPFKTGTLTCILEHLITIKFVRTISTVTYLWVVRKGTRGGRVNDSADKGGTSTSEQGSCSHLNLLTLFILFDSQGREKEEAEVWTTMRPSFETECPSLPSGIGLVKAKRGHRHQEEH